MTLKDYAQSYSESTDSFLEAVSLVTTENIDITDHAGWTARQIVHHMADSESQAAARLRRILAEPGTQILGYDENKWSECEALGYRSLPIQNATTLFKAARASSLEILQGLTDEHLSNFAFHSERGRFTLEDWIHTYSGHPVDHANQLREAIREEK